jgi:His/Glu/Gln/Arg/opine family amino acid ABC transporter permease subunit
MNFHFEQIVPSIPYILGGITVTLQYAFVSVCSGFVLGIFLALAKLSKHPFLRGFGGIYTSIFRGTPLLVQLTLVYYGAPQLIGYRISAFEAGILTFSLNSAAYVSEIIRAGVQAVDKGQTEAALALGLPHSLIMRAIILPQAIKNILPALVNEIIDLLKESALVSVIGEADLLRRANIVSAEKYLYFEPLIIVAAAYYVLVMLLTAVARTLEKRLRHD